MGNVVIIVSFLVCFSLEGGGEETPAWKELDMVMGEF